MKQDLRNKLLQWRHDKNAVGSRKVMAHTNPFQEGEYIITLQESINLKFGETTREIVAEKKFPTCTQILNHRELQERGLNENGDLFMLKDCINSIALDFINKQAAAISDLFDATGPDQEEIQ